MDNKLTHQYQLNKLKNDTTDVIKDKSLSQGFANPVVKNVTQHIDTKSIQPLLNSDSFTAKIAALTKAGSGAGKKLMGAVPLLGAGYAALSGEPAMAAEELVSDVVPGYEAIRSESAGMSPEDEKLMLAEIDAQKNYDNSPARLARMNALKGMK